MKASSLRAIACVLLGLAGGTAAAATKPLLAGLEKGVTLEASTSAGVSAPQPLLALAGDRFLLQLRAQGQYELVAYDSNGEPIDRCRHDAQVSGDACQLRFTAATDGAYFVSVLAKPGTPYSLRVERTLTSAPSVQVIQIPSALRTTLSNPVPIHAGILVAGDISASDFEVGPEWNADSMVFDGRKGEVVAFQLRSEVPTLLVRVQHSGSHTGKPLVEAPARDAPVHFTLPKDGPYFLVVHAKGAARIGSYVMAFGSGEKIPVLVEPGSGH